MLKQIPAEGVFLAPLAPKNTLFRNFEAAQTQMIIAALKKIDTSSNEWRDGTYIPAGKASEILKSEYGSNPQVIANLDYVGTYTAAMLAWQQSSILVELSRHQQIEVAGAVNIHKALPIDALSKLHHFAYAITSEAYRRGDRDADAVPVFLLAYVDGIKVPSGKILGELNIIRIHTWPKDPSLRADIVKIPLSEGLNFIDCARRVRRLEMKAANPDPRSILDRALARPKADENYEALEIALDVQMILAVDAEFKRENHQRPLIQPDPVKNTFTWPELKVFEFE